MVALRHTSEAAEITQRVSWYIFVRLLFLLAIGIPGTIAIYLTEGLSEQAWRDIYLLLAGLASNALFYALGKIKTDSTYQTYLAITWIILDILLISALIFANGGIESRSPILYTIPILISAALLGRQATYIAALVCAVIYSALIIGDYFGIITSVGAFDPTLRTNLRYVIQTVSFFPAIILVIALAVDFITKLLIKEQRQATNSLNALVRAQETAKLGSWEWDIANDQITWSAELYKIFELQPGGERLRFDTYLGMIHPDDLRSQKQIISRCVRKKTAFKVDHRAIMADGSVKYIHGEGRPIVDQNGTVIKLTGTAQDVTEMYHLDIAKREFVSLASHQLRTPASGVKAFLSLLADGYAGNLTKKQLEFVRKASRSNDRQLEIIDNLLSLASIESGKLSLNKTPIDLHELVKRCLPHHLPEIKKKRQRFSINEAGTPLIIRADPSHAQMAIDNLISNAIKYTPDKGTITVSLSATKTSAYLTVEDNGIGISRKDLPALFQKFSRLNDPVGKTVDGSGLGLYLARYIVELHGGAITLKSRHGVGTQFKIKFPLATNRKKAA